MLVVRCQYRTIRPPRIGNVREIVQVVSGGLTVDRLPHQCTLPHDTAAGSQRESGTASSFPRRSDQGQHINRRLVDLERYVTEDSRTKISGNDGLTGYADSFRGSRHSAIKLFHSSNDDTCRPRQTTQRQRTTNRRVPRTTLESRPRQLLRAEKPSPQYVRASKLFDGYG